MNKPLRFLSLLSVLIITILFYNAINKSDTDPITSTHKTYNIKSLKFPENLNLAGERVPIEKNDIRERMDRELLVNTYWQSNGLLLIKRANKYFPILEPLLKKYGL